MGYSVGKVRVPAGLSNRIPADAVLSIEQQFCACQGENDTSFRGKRYQDWLKEEFKGLRRPAPPVAPGD